MADDVLVVTVIGRCVRGVEWLVADEIVATLPGTIPVVGRREVTFALSADDLRARSRTLLGLRTVDDLFIEVGTLTSVGTTKADVAPLAASVARLPWAPALEAVRAVRAVYSREEWSDAPFDVVVSINGRRTYNRFAVEDAVGALLARVLGRPFTSRSDGAAAACDLTVRVFLDGSEAVVALRLGARPLHRRDYKQSTAPGTLHPPLAAAMCRLAAVTGPVSVDPFCGDGTLVVESLLVGPRADTPVGVGAADVRGGDLDPARVANARANAARAGLDPRIEVADAAHPGWGPGEIDAVITNPPWNVAVPAAGALTRSLEPFWRTLPAAMSGAGGVTAIVDAALGAPDVLRSCGYAIVLEHPVRIAGRISLLLLAGAPGHPVPAVSPSALAWLGDDLRADG